MDFTGIYRLIYGRGVDFTGIYRLIYGRGVDFTGIYRLIYGRGVDFTGIYRLIYGRGVDFTGIYRLIYGRGWISRVFIGCVTLRSLNDMNRNIKYTRRKKPSPAIYFYVFFRSALCTILQYYSSPRFLWE